MVLMFKKKLENKILSKEIFKLKESFNRNQMEEWF